MIEFDCFLVVVYVGFFLSIPGFVVSLPFFQGLRSVGQCAG